MNPAELRYTTQHEWVVQVSPLVLRFGITEFAAQSLGDVVFVELPAVGDTLTAGEPCGEVESTKSVSDLYAPVTGEVVAVNEALTDQPELVNSGPYTDGWMVEVSCADQDAADAALALLLDAAGYGELTA